MGRRSSTRRRLSTGTGTGSRTFSSFSRTGRTRSSTPSSRAGPRLLTSSSSASTPSSSLGFRGAGRPRCTSSTGSPSASRFGRTTSSPTTGGSSGGSSTRSRAREPTYPYPVDHCSLCEFLALCKEQWERDLHLSLVAGIRRTQVDRLTAAGIANLEALATTTETRIPKLRPETLAKLRDQAALQLHRRRTGELEHQILPLEPERGFALLPEPSPGDIWLDFEGDPWYEPARGLEYLFGWVYLDDDGEPQYDVIWALDRAQEKEGFERLLDLIKERRARHPGMHVYHYAPYERTALQRLMGQHGTREAELDDLLRGEVLVDLFRVVRQALRLSLDSYSIKEVEAFYGFERGEEMRGGGSAVVAFEEWLEAREDAILEEIRAYNEDDCRSLYELHRWLLELRPAEVEWRKRPEEREVTEETKERLEERALVEAELLADAEEGDPRWLLAQLLEYHRREEKPQWWAYFNNLQLDQDELFESAETMAGLELVGEPVPGQEVARVHARVPAAGAQDRRARPSTRRPSAPTA